MPGSGENPGSNGVGEENGTGRSKRVRKERVRLVSDCVACLASLDSGENIGEPRLATGPWTFKTCPISVAAVAL